MCTIGPEPPEDRAARAIQRLQEALATFGLGMGHKIIVTDVKILKEELVVSCHQDQDRAATEVLSADRYIHRQGIDKLTSTLVRGWVNGFSSPKGIFSFKAKKSVRRLTMDL